MKKLKHKKMKLHLILFASFLVSIVQAATVNLNNFWDGNPANLAQAFESAVNAAGTGGTVRLAARVYTTTRTINIDRRVIIEGVNNNTSIVRATRQVNQVFFIGANSVVFRRLTIDGNNRAGNLLRTGRNLVPPGAKNLRCNGVRFLNATGPSINPGSGNALSGLRLNSCSFQTNNNNAFPHIRLCNRRWNINPLPSIERFIIRNCTFRGRGAGSLNAANYMAFDAGNDDVNRATDLRGSIVEGCTFFKGGKWQIGFVECKNFTIRNNDFRGPGNFQDFQQCLHLEQFLTGVTITNNTFLKDNRRGDFIWAGGNDHGNGPVQGPSDIVVSNNTFTGPARFGYLDTVSTSADDNLFENNNFSNATFTSNAIRIGGSRNVVRCNRGLTRSDVLFRDGTNNRFIPFSNNCGSSSKEISILSSAKNDFSITPNPIYDNSFELKINSLSNSNALVRILSLSGSEVYVSNNNLQEGVNSVVIHTSEANMNNAGVYIVQIELKDHTITKKLIVR